MAKSFALVCLLGLLAGVSAQNCQQDSLTRHNDLRKLHGAGNLNWDAQLAIKAQTSANNLAKNKCALKGGSGGNVWACYGKKCGSCAVAVDEWYKGMSAYNFNAIKPYTDNEARFNEWGTFTQIVWKGAKKMACAIARGQDCAVVNCFYDIGNIQGDKWYQENVLPKTSSPSDGQIGEAWSAEELPECADWAASKYCEENGPEYLFTENGVTKSVTEWCPISCPTKRTPTKAIKKTSGPSDKQCEAWAQQGSCVPSGPLFFYQDPKTKEVRDIASWCSKACPYTPPGYTASNVGVARKMMSKLFLKATEDHTETTASA